MKRENLRNVFLVISAVFLFLSIYCIYEGIDKKDNYYNSEYSSHTVNAYVGGDAYNYIINAGYFAGYFALAGGSLVSSTVLFCAGMLLTVKEERKVEIADMQVKTNDVSTME